ncbi:MAG: hypothetical protein ABIF40_02720 [archaeon]
MAFRPKSKDNPTNQYIITNTFRSNSSRWLGFFFVILFLILFVIGIFIATGSKSLVTSNFEPFEVDQMMLKVSLDQGETLVKDIPVTNLIESPLTVSVRILNLNDLVSVSKSSLDIPPSQTDNANLILSAETEFSPDIYVGELLFSSRGYEEGVPVIIEIQSIDPSYDTTLDLLSDKRLFPGSYTDIEINVFNLNGVDLSDVNLVYELKGLDGEVLYHEEEVMAVGSRVSLLKNLNVPYDIAPGVYVYAVTVEHLGKIATSSLTLNIGTVTESAAGFAICPEGGAMCWSFFLIILSLFVLLIFVLFAIFNDRRKQYPVDATGQPVYVEKRKSMFIHGLKELYGMHQDNIQFKDELKRKRHREMVMREKIELQLKLQKEKEEQRLRDLKKMHRVTFAQRLNQWKERRRIKSEQRRQQKLKKEAELLVEQQKVRETSIRNIGKTVGAVFSLFKIKRKSPKERMLEKERRQREKEEVRALKEAKKLQKKVAKEALYKEKLLLKQQEDYEKKKLKEKKEFQCKKLREEKEVESKREASKLKKLKEEKVIERKRRWKKYGNVIKNAGMTIFAISVSPFVLSHKWSKTLTQKIKSHSLKLKKLREEKLRLKEKECRERDYLEQKRCKAELDENERLERQRKKEIERQKLEEKKALMEVREERKKILKQKREEIFEKHRKRRARIVAIGNSVLRVPKNIKDYFKKKQVEKARKRNELRRQREAEKKFVLEQKKKQIVAEIAMKKEKLAADIEMKKEQLRLQEENRRQQLLEKNKLEVEHQQRSEERKKKIVEFFSSLNKKWEKSRKHHRQFKKLQLEEAEKTKQLKLKLLIKEKRDKEIQKEELKQKAKLQQSRRRKKIFKLLLALPKKIKEQRKFRKIRNIKNQEQKIKAREERIQILAQRRYNRLLERQRKREHYFKQKEEEKKRVLIEKHKAQEKAERLRKIKFKKLKIKVIGIFKKIKSLPKKIKRKEIVDFEKIEKHKNKVEHVTPKSVVTPNRLFKLFKFNENKVVQFEQKEKRKVFAWFKNRKRDVVKTEHEIVKNEKSFFIKFKQKLKEYRRKKALDKKWEQVESKFNVSKPKPWHILKKKEVKPLPFKSKQEPYFKRLFAKAKQAYYESKQKKKSFKPKVKVPITKPKRKPFFGLFKKKVLKEEKKVKKFEIKEKRKFFFGLSKLIEESKQNYKEYKQKQHMKAMQHKRIVNKRLLEKQKLIEQKQLEKQKLIEQKQSIQKVEFPTLPEIVVEKPKPIQLSQEDRELQMLLRKRQMLNQRVQQRQVVRQYRQTQHVRVQPLPVQLQPIQSEPVQDEKIKRLAMKEIIKDRKQAENKYREWLSKSVAQMKHEQGYTKQGLLGRILGLKTSEEKHRLEQLRQQRLAYERQNEDEEAQRKRLKHIAELKRRGLY